MRGREEGNVKNDSWFSGKNNGNRDVCRGDLWGKIKDLVLVLLSSNSMNHLY